MSILNKTFEAYKEILEVLDKHKDICIFDITELKNKAKRHLFGIELTEKYGLKLNPKTIDSMGWNRFDDYRSIGMWGKKYNRTIGCSVDGRQPENELLLTLGFSSGSYIFSYSGMSNEDYPETFFQKFWLELKSFNPDYIDEANHSLYWNISNAKDIFNCFNEVLAKYQGLNKEDIKRRKIDKMKKELSKLENKQ